MIRLAVLTVLFSLLFGGRAVGQIYILPKSDFDAFVGVGASANPILKAQLSGAYRFKNAFGGENDLTLTASLGAPVTLLGKFNSFDALIGGAYHVHILHGWTMNWVGAATLSTAGNINGNFAALGFDLALAPGYRAENWFANLWIGGQYKLATHIAHSDYARRAFTDRYPDAPTASNAPQDGWYRTNAWIWQVGANGGYQIGAVALSLNLGLQVFQSESGAQLLPDIGLMPFYGHFGIVYCFGK